MALRIRDTLYTANLTMFTPKVLVILIKFFFLQIFHKERKNAITSSKLYINAAEAINSINFNRVILMKIKHMNSFSIHVNLIFIFANMFPYHHNDHSTRLSCGLL